MHDRPVSRGLYQGNIIRFYVYRAFVYFYLWLPIWVIYLQRMRDLTLAEIGLIGAAGWIASALAEVPAGAFADRFGRRLSLAVGAFVYAVGVFSFALSSNIWLLMMSDVVWTAGFAFISGADLALVYDSLKADGRQDEYVRINGRATVVLFAAQALAGLVGAPLATVQLNLPHMLAGVLAVVAGSVALIMREPPTASPTSNGTGSRRTYRETVSLAMTLLSRSRRLRLAVLFSIFTFVPPFLVFYIFLQPYAAHVGVPIAWMGALLLGLRIPSMLGSELAHRVAGRFGEARILYLVPATMAAALAGTALIPTLNALGFVALLLLASAINQPLVSAIVNRQVDSEIRATLLSFVTLLQTLLVGLTQPLYGLIADAWGVGIMMAGLAAGLVVTATPVLALWRPTDRNLQKHEAAS